jgi:hypothetical protein
MVVPASVDKHLWIRDVCIQELADLVVVLVTYLHNWILKDVIFVVETFDGSVGF